MARKIQPRDERAMSLVDGDKFREYGMDEIHEVGVVDYHGDTVLITTTDDLELSFDIDEVVEVDPEEDE